MSASKHPSPWYYAGVTGGIVNTTAVTLAPAITNTIANGGTLPQRNFLSDLQYFNTAAVASEIVIIDSATSNVLWRGNVPASQTIPIFVPFQVPLESTPNSALQVQLLTTGTATRVSAQGFTDT